jgi:hypothetical protein
MLDHESASGQPGVGTFEAKIELSLARDGGTSENSILDTLRKGKSGGPG